MAKIKKNIFEWKEEGFITSEQAEKIIKYENSKRKVPWGIYSLIMLGVTIIGIGIISTIAANWENIPDGVKIFVDFSILIGIALVIFKFSSKDNPILFDALSAFFIFFYLASIGLIAQIYHTGGHLHQAFFLLTIATLPLTLLTYKRFLTNIWVIAFLSAIILLCTIGFIPEDKFIAARVGLLASMPMLCASAGSFLSIKKITQKLSAPFVYWAFLSFLGAVITFDIFHSTNPYYNSELENILSYFSPFYIIVYLSCISVVVSAVLNKNISGKIRIGTIILGVAYSLMLVLCIPLSSGLDRTFLEIISPGVFFIMMLLLSFIFSAMDNKRLFNLCIRLIGIRFLIVYFQVFGSLAYTGFGLIFSGIVIIGSVVLWYKFHERVENWFGGLFK